MGRMLGRDKLPCYYQDHGNGTVSYWEEAACDSVIRGGACKAGRLPCARQVVGAEGGSAGGS